MSSSWPPVDDNRCSARIDPSAFITQAASPAAKRATNKSAPADPRHDMLVEKDGADLAISTVFASKP